MDKFYLRKPRAQRNRAGNHRWRNFLDDLKEQMRSDKNKVEK